MRKRLCEMMIIALIMLLFYHYAQNLGETHLIFAEQNTTKESSEKIPKETSEEALEEETAESYQKSLQSAKPDWTVRPESYDDAVVSDFLSMNTEEFEKKYDKKELYDRDILYCTREAWKYDGERVDGFQEADDCYDVEEITAIRFTNGYFADMDMWEERDTLTCDQEAGNAAVQYFGEYAMSMYFRQNPEAKNGEEGTELIELSYIKVKLDESDSREAAPAVLYEDIERYYYEVQEEIKSGEWAVSPDQTKAVCISNGMIPKHPAQIFVRYQEKHPDLIFRRTWECRFAGWIDENHFICYNDFGPVMIHLETDQVENIKTEEDDYDGYGCYYEIQGNQLIAMFLDEEYYRWDIVRQDDEIRMLKTDVCDELKEMLEANLFPGITFQKDEKAIVFYEKNVYISFDGYQILVYKETAEKDILLEAVLRIEKETGDIYILGEEDWELAKAGALKDLNLPESLETASVCEVYEKETDEEVVFTVLNQVFDFLRTEEGFSDFKIMYDGNTSFLGRKYYNVKLIEDNGIMIHTLQRYHIDMETGNLYEENDHMITGDRMELLYMGNIVECVLN